MNRKLIIPILAWLWLMCWPFSGYASDLQGRVVGISDGDTIKVLVWGNQLKIRLSGIDCPEKGQPFGRKGTDFTRRLAAGKDVKLKIVTRDRYGRLVAEVILPDGRVLNHELVKAGYAWWYRKYAAGDRVLASLEAEARLKKRGLWSESEPVPPWDWRRNPKGAGKAIGAPP